jgi:hypothetical protein
VRGLESMLGVNCKDGGALIVAIGRTIGKLRAEMLADHGVWREGEHYPKNALVSHDGALWRAKAETSERPGNGQTLWRMMTKTETAEVRKLIREELRKEPTLR